MVSEQPLRIPLTEDQKVTITLKEFMEYQELKDHRKDVKITEISNYTDTNVRSINVDWHSDGKVWNLLTAKLGRAGFRIDELQKEVDTLKKWKKVGFWKRVLIRMVKD